MIRLSAVFWLVLRSAAVMAAAEPGAFRTYSTRPTGAPVSIALTFDGYLWFTEPDANKIGRMNLRDGSLVEFTVPTPDAGLAGITSLYLPTGNVVWFTESRANQIGLVTSDGTIREFPVPTPESEPWGIASDFFSEQVWFTERRGNAIARVHPDGRIEEFSIPSPVSLPTGIAVVPGDFGVEAWFTAPGRNAIGRWTTRFLGEFSEIPIPTPDSDPQEIVFAADGALWFTERAGDRIGRIVAGGITEFPLTAGSRPTGLAGDLSRSEFLWFTEPGGNRLGFVTVQGEVTEYPLPQNVSGPLGIVTDGYEAWFAAAGSREIVRVEPDLHVVVGFGSVGPWTSSLALASVEPRARSVYFGVGPFPPGSCPGQCGGVAFADLPAYGTAPFDGQPRYGFPGLTSLFSRPLRTGRLPTVHFRYENSVFPTMAADAPVVRLSALTASDPAVLSFPSGASGDTVTSNLFLANIGGDGGASALVEAFTSEGHPLGARTLSLEPFSLQTIPDVLQHLDAPDIENAQVRVTRTSGDGRLWGSLAIVREGEGTLSVSAGSNLAAASDVVLIAGGGLAGPWDTVLDFSNPGSTVLDGQIHWRDPGSSPGCPAQCPHASYTVPPDGTARSVASQFLPEAWSGPRLLAATGGAVVHARVVNRARPTQAADLPTVPLAVLAERNPRTIVFPSATRDAQVRTNLFLVGVGSGEGIRALVEVLSSSGDLLGETRLHVVSWDEPGSTLVVDLLARLGIAELRGGQVRVTRESGDQLLWGALSNVYADGRLSVVPGLNP